MMRTTNLIRPLPATALALAAVLSAQPAAAGVFGAFADATLGYTLGAGTLPDISYQYTPTVDPSAPATGDATLTLGGDDFVLASSISGNGEVAASSTESDLVITIENLTGDTVELIWQLSYSLGASSAYALPGERAYAEAFIDLFTDGYVLSGTADVSELLEADADVDGSPPGLGDSVSFTLELLEDELVEIGLTIGTYGEAAGTAVPAPPVLALLAPGLALLRLRRAPR